MSARSSSRLTFVLWFGTYLLAITVLPTNGCVLEDISNGVTKNGQDIAKNAEAISAVKKKANENGQDLAKILALLKSDHCVQPTITSICDPRDTIRGSGVYRIKLRNVQAFTAYCDMDTDGGGWLVFQRREDGTENFYRDYDDYVKGFGKREEEHWLGLELLHRLTNFTRFKLRVDLGDWEGNKAYATYSSFSIGGASSGYRLSVSGYTGTAGDAMARANGQKFSTFDKDQDVYRDSCAILYRGAWWYDRCHNANLNSVYERATVRTYANTVVWRQWKDYYYSLKFAEMKIKINA